MSLPLPCVWLGLPDETWPPNYYTLLGLETGEADPQVIEHHALERLARVRCHQLANPELATEAMRLLAQAVDCLTNPAARSRYDQQILGLPETALPAPTPSLDLTRTPRPSSATRVTKLEDPPTTPKGPDEEQLDWLNGPWPSDQGGDPNGTVPKPQELDWSVQPPPSRRPVLTDEAEPTNPTQPRAIAPFPVDVPPLDPAIHAAKYSVTARQGLATSRALYERVLLTRTLLAAWREAGDAIDDPKRQLRSKAAAVHFVRQLSIIRDTLPKFPPLLGRDGQPGYYVVIIARQQNVVQAFRDLILSQRDRLAQDWRTGLDILEAHYQYLRQELKLIRRKNRWARTLRTTRYWVTDHAFLVFALVVLVIALIAWLKVPVLKR